MTLVIGICGPAGSGKSTVARYLERNYGARCYALAEPLKVIIQRAFRLEYEQLWGPQARKEAVDDRYNVSPRWLMQHIGTEGFRSVMGDDFWVNYTMGQIRRHKPALAVIEDVRFLSEAGGIIESEFLHEFWRLDTPWRESTADPNHQSEAEWNLIPADRIIAPPVKTLEALFLEVDKACARLGIQPILNSIEAP